ERIKHHFEYVIDVSVILAVDKLPDKEKRQRAEINLRLRGKDLHVQSIAQDLYAAIDTLIDKLDRQLVKYKSKLKDHQRSGIKNVEQVAPDAAAIEVADAADEAEAEAEIQADIDYSPDTPSTQARM